MGFSYRSGQAKGLMLVEHLRMPFHIGEVFLRERSYVCKNSTWERSNKGCWSFGRRTILESLLDSSVWSVR